MEQVQRRPAGPEGSRAEAGCWWCPNPAEEGWGLGCHGGLRGHGTPRGTRPGQVCALVGGGGQRLRGTLKEEREEGGWGSPKNVVVVRADLGGTRGPEECMSSPQWDPDGDPSPDAAGGRAACGPSAASPRSACPQAGTWAPLRPRPRTVTPGSRSGAGRPLLLALWVAPAWVSPEQTCVCRC